MTGPRVGSVHLDGKHRFGKLHVESITLRAGLGVEGDAHFGTTVQHLSRVAREPEAPNLRQVHLLAAELLDELVAQGFGVEPGSVGENVTTRDVDLLGLPTGAVLRIGRDATIEITGLRNPCVQLDRFQHGLQRADGNLIRRAGVMAIVLRDGDVRPGDPIEISLPVGPHEGLRPV
jgi:hypothetical protein